ncbi:glycosyl hydrolase family 28-related protein [Hephaestia mangrovi]|uniref:glycosyl hydrolase family 28-related protein n=1 Tax=Hephaestia mangrovi TaxID=2873268 RepID=UPI001CA6D74E|nr:glycosyl hydrolase family 28-related protein [Hephaestia mangrovi]MBY8828049.1 SMP-30/gluconolactonase/LRE family protein [Hephaestia mangrovi]
MKVRHPIRRGARGVALGAALLLSTTALAAPSHSVFATAPQDARAITVRAAGDGITDDTAALQAAIDSAYGQGGGGIVFLPAGRYRLTHTLYMRPGVRLFGIGKTRPVFVLADNTPGFQKGVATMVIFAGNGPDSSAHVPFPPPDSVPANAAIADANPGTFYSAMSNVDFAIGKGNPAAIGVRFHAAQHAYLSHIDFDLGSGLAGIYQVGNIMKDLHFHGGRYGILTEKPSPAWQFTLIDSSFDGQRDAAIREHEAGLTLVNVTMRDTPVGIDIDKGYGDWLFGKNVRFENIARAGVVISNEGTAYTQVNFENALASNTPTFARFRDSGRTVPGKGNTYRVSDFGYGMTVPGLGRTGHYETVMKAEAIGAMPAAAPPAIRPLPPVSEWVNVRDLGIVGDDKTDDTAAIQHAIDTHRVLYFPAGFYHVSDTLKLRPDTVLIGLHPSLTQIVLPDGTPGYQGVGAPKALVEAPRGGDNIVSGLGLYTSGINDRATALLWKAGANSLVDDVKIQGGHGTYLYDGTRFDPYNATHTGDADPRKRWGAQYASIWVTDGGGGTFAGIWSPDTYAKSGFRVSYTDTPGHIYELSNEHHVRTEIELDHVANWELLAPQTEEEGGEGRNTVSLSIRNSHDILVANYHGYRVTRTVKPVRAAVELENVADIRFRNVHVNSESGIGLCDDNGCTTFLRLSKFPYSNAIHDITHGLEVREREFARLDVPADPATPPASGPQPTKLAGDFWSASGATVGPDGTLYFVDNHFQRIWSWSTDKGLKLVRDDTLDPVNLAMDKAGDLLVLSSAGKNGTVYSFRPDAPATDLSVIEPQPAAGHPGADTLLPGNWWVNGEFKDQLDPDSYQFTTLGEMFRDYAAAPKAEEYLSPDGSLVLPAFRTISLGPPNHLGLRFSDTLDAYSIVPAMPGSRVYLSNDSQDVTYTGLVGANGAVTDPKRFADRGGESVVAGPDGRVYVANGQVFVYHPDGTAAGEIDVPERPLQLIFGGKDKNTLFILTHHSLYAVQP